MQPARVVGRVEVDRDAPAVPTASGADSVAPAAAMAALMYAACDTGGR